MPELHERLARLSPRQRELLMERLRTAKPGTETARARIVRQPRVAGDGTFPLSFAQQRLWFLERLTAGSSAYSLPVVLRLKGPLRCTALRRSLGTILGRHEILRTRFEAIDGEPVQRISPRARLAFAEIDLGALPPPARLGAATAEVHRELRRRFDLARGPLFRCLLLRLGAGESVLVVNQHHIITDGWSIGRLLDELAAGYESQLAGRPAALPPVALQYADYAVWQRQQAASDAARRSLRYWKDQFAELSPTELPSDFSRPAVYSFRGASSAFAVPASLLAELRRLSRGHGVTLFMTLLGAFQLLLRRYAASDDVALGTPTANRSREELESVLGYFANTLVLRTDLGGNPSFRELLGRIRKTVTEADAHQDFPFEKLVDELQPERDLSRNPLFQIMFSLESRGAERRRMADLEIRPFACGTSIAKFDLTLFLRETERELEGAFEYCTDLFREETIAAMARQYMALLASIAHHPGAPIETLELLGPGEYRELERAARGEAGSYPRDCGVAELFERVAASAPAAPALLFDGRTISYAALNRRANRLARRLRELGVGAEAPVAICLERSAELVVGLLAILKAGGSYVPLDPSYPRERLALMLAELRPRALLTVERRRDALPVGEEPVLCLDADWTSLAGFDDGNLGLRVAGAQLAYVVYTSGSTGRPKGIGVPQRAIRRLVLNTDYVRLGPADRLAFASNISFDAATFEIWGALLNGAALVGLDPDTVFSPRALARKLARHRVTAMFLTTALFNRIVEQEPAAFAGVGTLLFGGEAVDPAKVRRLLEACPPARLLHVYGPTENTTFTSWHRVREVVANAATVPIGRPIANTDVHVLDRSLRRVPAGVPGELYAGGEGLACGYFGRPSLTAEHFLPNPFATGRLYRTGDLVRHQAAEGGRVGPLEFLGRADQQIKLRGFRIELGEIEAAIRSTPAVAACAVLLRHDGPSGKWLVGYLVPNDHGLDLAALRRHLAERLPKYMIPAAFVTLDELPLTPNGKVNRAALPAPDDSREAAADRFVAPRTRIEERLAAIWKDMLGVRRVGIDDNFFALGGDSILSIRIVSRARSAGLRLSTRQLFQNQTIRELAAVVGETAGAAAAQELVTGPVPLTPIQRWFFDLRSAHPHHGNQAVLLKLRQPLDAGHFRRACRRLLAHHDALRSRYVLRDGVWCAFQEDLAAAAPLPVIAIDLSRLAAAERWVGALEAAAARLQASLDLGRGPILRIAHFHLGTEVPARLLIVIHHLVVDGISWRILIEDLQSPELPAKTTSFQEWARRLQEYADSPSLSQELAAWEQQLPPAGSRLPVDDPAGGNLRATEKTVTVALEGEETELLLQRVPRLYRTQINDVLLTALAETLAAWTGDDRVPIALEGHGREELDDGVDLTRTVGWFTSLFPVTLKRWPDASVGPLLKDVKEQLRRIPRRGIGYGLLRYLAGDPRVRERLETKGFPQISFNYLGQFDQSLAGGAFAIADEDPGPSFARQGEREYLLEVTGSVTGARLRMSWLYSSDCYRDETVRALAESFLSHLRAILHHATTTEAYGFTPSDFPLLGLDQARLDTLAEALRAGSRAQLVEDIYPLSPLQKGLLFHSLYAPQSGAYVEQFAFLVEGRIEAGHFETAWRRVIERTPVLRTAFHWTGLAEPVQIVYRELPWQFATLDWSGKSPGEREAGLERFLDEDKKLGFELDQPPLVRFALIRLAAQQHYFLWTVHHALIDGWSLPLVFAEFSSCYSALCRNEELRPRPRRPYRDYIAWLGKQDPIAAERFWRPLLAGFKNPLDLSCRPVRELPVERLTDRWAKQHAILDRATAQGLRHLAKARRVTLANFLQGAWGLLLARYSGEDDLVFGAAVSGRPPELPGVEEMIGLFTNAIPVRIRVRRRETALAWAGRLQQAMIDVRQYETSTLAEVQRWSELAGGVRLFDYFFVVENYPVDAQKAAADELLRFTEIDTAEITDYSLVLVCVPGEEIALRICYDRTRFDDTFVRRFLSHLTRVLEAFARHPQARLDGISLLSRAEAHQLLVDWNDGRRLPRPAGGRRAVDEIVARQVRKTPDAIALKYGRDHLSYGELDRRANALAAGLARFGVACDAPVGIYLPQSADMVCAMLGILKAGGAYLPLDLSYPKERLGTMLRDSRAEVALTRSDLAETLAGTVDEVLVLDRDVAWEEGSAARAPRPCVDAAGGRHLACILYTSGSTGQPKGIGVPHRAICYRFLENHAVPLAPSTRMAQQCSVSFDAALLEIWGPLLNGGCVIGIPKATALSPYELRELLRNERVTSAFMTTSLFDQTVRMVPECFATLDHLFFGGEVADPESARRVVETSPPKLLINIYGPTEATTAVASHAIGPRDVVDGSPIPIGRPYPDVGLFVLDRHLLPVPAGVAGELYLGGRGLARAYLHQGARTAERFVPHPCPPGRERGQRLYRTGDLVRYAPDGRLRFVQRIDHQVKLRGFRIELEEIESALNQHPDVAQSLVVLRAGNDDRFLAAYLTARGSRRPREDDVRAYLEQSLPEFMIPSSFTVLERFPLTPNGKLDRDALPEPHRAASVRRPSGEAPANQLEEVIAEIWIDVLRLEGAGRNDDFFELGGHSLHTTQIISRLRQDLEIDLPLATLFDHPTIAGLAAAAGEMLTGGTVCPPPIERCAGESPPPLSFAQQRLWLLDRTVANQAAYNIPNAVRLRGELELAALGGALARVVERHETLRTNFVEVAGEGRPVLHPQPRIPAMHVDLRGLAPARRLQEADDLLRRSARYPFDLERDPLLRLITIALGDADTILFLNMHHITTDGWSMEILWRELGSVWSEIADSKPISLTPLPIRYSDFAAWQAQWLRGETLEGYLEYWRRELADLPSTIELPYDRPRPRVPSFRGAVHSFGLTPEAAAGIRAARRRYGVTTFMVLLAHFYLLLHKHSGQCDLPVGSVVANRSRREIEGLIGFFVNTLVLRGRLSPSMRFRDLIRDTRALTLRAFAHQEIPFEKIVSELVPERDLSLQPFFQIVFTVQSRLDRAGETAFPGLDAEPMYLDRETAKFDLTLTIYDTGDELDADCEYSTDLFDPITIERMMVRFSRLLAETPRGEDRPIFRFDLLSDSERNQCLREWNRTATDYPRELCVPLVFERQAERCPHARAVVYGDRTITYGELNRRANRLARYLVERGVGTEVPVAVCLDRSPEVIVAFLAILKAGGFYVPLDTTFPAERLRFMVGDAQPAVVVTQASHAEIFSGTGCDLLVPQSDRQIPERYASHDLGLAVPPETLAYMIYTSGSTGIPKGIGVPHRAILRLVLETDYVRLTPSDRVAQGSNMSFDAATFELWGALLNGGCLIGIEKEVLLSPQDLSRRLAGDRTTALFVTTALFNQIAREAPRCFAGLDHLLFGGEAVDPGWVRAILESAAPRRLLHVYGPTEATTFATWFEIVAVARDAETVAIGRPLANTQGYVCDRSLQPVPPGVAGELLLGGDGLARGYYRRPQLTAERLIPHPWSDQPGERLYRTGDVVRHARDGSGQIEFMGRIDTQVKLRGFRIELGEIEARLARHPAVADCLVTVREEETKKILVAYAVPHPRAEVSPEALREHLRQSLPAYMIPAVCMLLDAFPLNPNGKIDRAALPRPSADRPELDGEYAAPRNPVEAALAEIWGSVLGVDRVGIYDNFFDLGGDSLVGIRIISKAKEAGLGLSVKELFEHQSIAELAQVAATATTGTAEQQEVVGSAPVVPIQAWFLEQELRDPHHFNQSALLRAPEGLIPQILRRTVAALMSHHDSLRLRFSRDAGRWRQIFEPPGEDLPLAVIDLARAADGRGALQAHADRLQQSLDPFRGPVCRWALFDLGRDCGKRLLIIIHHLVVDALSWQILLEDLETSYRQALAGRAIELPAKTHSFKQWAERLSEHAASGRLGSELEPWLDLARAWKYEGLRPDGPGGEAPPLEGDAQTVSQRLELPTVDRAQTHEVVLAALVRAFARETGEPALLLDLEGHGREPLFEDVDVSRTVGWFTSMFPVLFELPPGEDPGEALSAVERILRRIPNRGLGFGLLRYLSADPEHLEQLKMLPRPQVSFNFFGQAGGESARETAFVAAGEPFGEEGSPRNRRAHALDLVGRISDGRLTLRWTYCSRTFRRETIERLAQRFRDALAQAHRSPAELVDSDVDLSAENLNDLLREMGLSDDEQEEH